MWNQYLRKLSTKSMQKNPWPRTTDSFTHAVKFLIQGWIKTWHIFCSETGTPPESNCQELSAKSRSSPPEAGERSRGTLQHRTCWTLEVETLLGMAMHGGKIPPRMNRQEWVKVYESYPKGPCPECRLRWALVCKNDLWRKLKLEFAKVYFFLA